jgi:DdrB-like protein
MSKFDQLISVLERIAGALESFPKPAPDIVRNLSDYPRFPWASIGAEVIASDKHGATAVRCGGKVYVRRNPSNKYGVAIWYSRATGREGDETTYERLITFKEVKVEADPLSEKTVALLRSFRQAS